MRRNIKSCQNFGLQWQRIHASMLRQGGRDAFLECFQLNRIARHTKGECAH